jgi:fructosamine-3-kinase
MTAETMRPHHISHPRIQQIAVNAGLGQCSATPIGAGHYNDSFYIDSEKGMFVLRIAPADSVPKLFYEVDMMKSEPAIHELVKKHTDIPVPGIIYFDFSRKCIDADFLIMEFLEGSPGSFKDGLLGRYVRQLHNIEGDYFGYPERAAPTSQNWPEIFATYVELIFGDCLSCGIIDRRQYDWFLSVYEKHLPAVVDVRPSLLHLDLWTQNILTVDGEITAILDFDRGLFGDVELEFAVLDTYGYATEEFFEGYGKPRPVDAGAQIRRRLYIVYELIKYAFIRFARNGSFATGRSHVEQCAAILREIA